MQEDYNLGANSANKITLRTNSRTKELKEPIQSKG
jgi:hypothetical protein